MKLNTRALIKRDKDSGILTVHRLIQAQFRLFLGPEKCQNAFNDTVTLLSYVIPKSGLEKGQLYDIWEAYNRYLQHVINLRDVFNEEMRTSHPFTATQEFCEILGYYQRFEFPLPWKTKEHQASRKITSRALLTNHLLYIGISMRIALSMSARKLAL